MGISKKFAILATYLQFINHYHHFMLVLGIETSCDETGIALYHTDHGLLAHALHSQVEMHAEYGGVVPGTCLA